MQRLEDMAAVASGAGGAGRDVDLTVLKAVDNALRAKAGDGEIDDVRRVLLSEQNETRHVRERLAAEVAELLHVRDAAFKARELVGAGRAEAADAGEIFGAGAVVGFLPAACDQRRQRQTRADVQRAHALCGVNLMAGDGDHIRAERFCLEGELEKALHGVGVEQRERAEPPRGADHLADGHDGAGLIVDHHHGDENGVGAERLRERLGGDIARLVGLEIGDLKAARLQPLHRVQNGVVLHGGGDDVPAALSKALCRAGDRPVVGLGAAGGKENALRLGAERLRHLLAGRFQALFGFDPQRVYGGGVSPRTAEKLGHRIDAGPGRLRRGGIV